MIKEFEGKQIYERIELILNNKAVIHDINELFENPCIYDYNVSRPDSISNHDLKEFQMKILDATIHENKIYHIAKCTKCGKIRTYTYDKVQYMLETVPYNKAEKFYKSNGFCCGGII